jgi:Flp pilus assembly protein TadB
MNRKTLAGDRRRRKLITLLWTLGLAAIVIALIYLERTAILYILCTLGVSVLLMIVAFADLAQHEVTGQQVAQSNDAVGARNKAR